jgi:hypothetical protein
MMADLLLANIGDETTDDEIKDFLIRYGFPPFDRILEVPGTGSLPAVLVTFDGLDPKALRHLQGRIHNIMWNGRTVTARIVRDRGADASGSSPQRDDDAD